MEPHVIIAGAGPAGLTAAYELGKHGMKSTVLEASSVVGGLAQTVEYKGYRFDIGGHRFFTKNKEIDALWTEMLPNDFIVVDRISRIYYKKKFFSYPLKPFEALWKLGPVEDVRIMISYLWTKFHQTQPEVSFEDWVVNRFGWRLFSVFFKTYTEKVWGIPCSKISADWAAQRIKGLSLTAAVKNALFPGRAAGTIKTLVDRFRYPRLGPGMLWERVKEIVEQRGSSVVFDQKVVGIRRKGEKVVSFVTQDPHGTRKEWKGSHFISSMPLRELLMNLTPAPPAAVIRAAEELQYRDFLVVALILKKPDLFPDNWIYIHDSSVLLGRIQNFRNWSREMVPEEGMSCLGLEYFCAENDTLWAMDDQELIRFAARELEAIGLADQTDVVDGKVVRMFKAYPVYDNAYQERLVVIKDFLRTIPNLYVAGRNGMHKYNNQDHAMLTALFCARNILGAQYDVWKVNADAEYHEEIGVDERLVPKAL